MKGKLIPVAGGLLAFAFGSQAAFSAEPTPLGVWRDSEKGSIIQIYECGSVLCAKVVKPYQAGARDSNNPNPALRDRPITGLTFMNGAKKSSANVWKGTLYNAEDGKSYSGSMTLVSNGELQMQGCAYSIFCQTRVFSRVK
jgi:uncharacterized protein (DUF2147 family)